MHFVTSGPGLCLLALTASLHGVRADDSSAAYWPQFRGPNASGYSSTAVPPTAIEPAHGELWSADIPWSPSSPCVWGDWIFLTTFSDGALETRAHDRSTGSLLWSRKIKAAAFEPYHITDGSPAASTPATDGHRVVSYFGSFGLVCYGTDGEELWRHPLPLALSGGSYGSGTSPVIFKNRVLLNRDQELNSSILAVDLATGSRLWETPRPTFGGSFGTPVVWQNKGRDEVVLPGSTFLKGYNVADGNEVWSVGGISAFVCTTPVLGDDMLYFAGWSPGKADSSFPTDWPSFQKQFDSNGDGRVVLSEFDRVTADFLRGIDRDRDGEITDADLAIIRSSAERAANVLIAVKPGGSGDITRTHVPWSYNRGLPYVPSPLYLDGRVYYVKDGGMVSSVDAKSGKPFYYQERIGATGSYYASPVAADGRIYLASLPGKLTVIKAGGDSPEILHQADFKERIFATPALVGNHVYLRTEKTLYAFGPATHRNATASISK